MAHKKKHPEHENLERWLVSYADFMTLLFATFTALYALAQTDAAKLKDVGAAIREGFSEQSIINGVKSILDGKSPPTANPDPIASDKGAGAGVLGKFDSMTYMPGEVKSTQHMVDDLTSDLKNANKAIQQAMAQAVKAKALEKGMGEGLQPKAGSTVEDPDTPLRPVEVAFQQRGVRISFDSRLLFTTGSAKLQPAGMKVLDVVAKRLKAFDNRRFHIEGHTDATGIATTLFPSNWELSTARASGVVRYFIDRHQFNPAAMVAVGYGSTQPLADNRTSEGRTRNRRVDIILYNAQESMKLNPRVQFLNERPVSTKSADAIKPAATITPIPTGTTPVKMESRASDAPVRVIIKEKDGTERIWVPSQAPAKHPTIQQKGHLPESKEKQSEIPSQDKSIPLKEPHPKKVSILETPTHSTSKSNPNTTKDRQKTVESSTTSSPPVPPS